MTLADEDHARGCEGRTFACTCGYDDRVEAALRGTEPAKAGQVTGAEDLADEMADVINDSIDQDWLPRHAVPNLMEIFDRECTAHRELGIAQGRALERAEAVNSTTDEWNHYMDDAVNKAPEPLRQLGEYLAELLHEDQWKTAERYLNAAAIEAGAADMQKLREVIRLYVDPFQDRPAHLANAIAAIRAARDAQ